MWPCLEQGQEVKTKEEAIKAFEKELREAIRKKEPGQPWWAVEQLLNVSLSCYEAGWDMAMAQRGED